jgi:uncharacterized protein YjhX (UPF0386 family)
MPQCLRTRILETLRTDGEIISIFQFLCNQGYYHYSYGLQTFRALNSEGLIIMTKTNGRGSPWRVTRSEPCKTIRVS